MAVTAATVTLGAAALGADPTLQTGSLPRTPLVSQVTAPGDRLQQQRSGPDAGSGRAAAVMVRPVTAVDLERYVGLWYEIARVPAWFQSGCEGETTARYQRRGDGRIIVVNTCQTRNGKIRQARGIARVIDTNTNARLQVSFVSFLGWRPFWGDYWILALDPDYRWAVIGDPSRRYGWILSRTPQMDAATLELCFEALVRNGYQRSSFVLTPQSPGDRSPSSSTR